MRLESRGWNRKPIGSLDCFPFETKRSFEVIINSGGGQFISNGLASTEILNSRLNGRRDNVNTRLEISIRESVSGETIAVDWHSFTPVIAIGGL